MILTAVIILIIKNENKQINDMTATYTKIGSRIRLSEKRGSLNEIYQTVKSSEEPFTP